MDLYTRIGMYFFIIGALLSILDGAFFINEEVRGLIYIVLIFTGIFAGLLNISEDEEHHFLLASGVFILVIMGFNQIFAGHPLLSRLDHFFQSAVTFVGSMALVVAIKTILEFGSQNYHVTPQENMKLRTKDIDDWNLSKGLKTWHFIIFLAVAVTFLIILLGLPIYRVPGPMQAVMDVLEWLIIVIFLLDLIVLYRHEKSFGDFLKNCWIDIVAAIPIPGIFGALKILRISRIARISHSVKFFSQKSGVDTYLRKSARREEPLIIDEHPRVKQKTSAKQNVSRKR